MNASQSGIKIFVPAVATNLGPYPGTFCAALQDVGIEVKVSLREHGGIQLGNLEGAKGLDIEQAWRHVITGVEALIRAAGKSDVSLLLHLHYRMPVQRGLHEDVCACVSGVIAANEVLRRPLEKAALFDVISKALHSLHLAKDAYLAKAALDGGLVLRDNASPEEGFYRMPVPRGLQLLVLVPDVSPIQVSHPTETKNRTEAARSAAFVHALYLAHFDLLRSTMRPRSTSTTGDEILDTLLDCMLSKDALGAGISGNGPCLWGLFVNTHQANEVVLQIDKHLAPRSIFYKFWIREINQEGAIKC